MYYNTGVFGCFLTMPLIIAAGLAIYYYKTGRKKLFYVSISFLLLITVQLFLLTSRTAWIASLCGVSFIVMAVDRTRNIWVSKSKIFRTVVLFSVLPVLLLCSYGLYTMKKDSADGRILIWTVSSSIFGQNLFTGSGSDTFSTLYMDAQATYFENDPDSEYNMLADEMVSTGNEFLKQAVEGGLMGLTMVLLIIGLLLFKSKLQSDKSDKVILFYTVKALFLAMLIVAFLTSALQIYHFRILCLLFIAYLSARTNKMFSIDIPVKYFNVIGYSLLSAVIILSVAAIIYAKPYQDALEAWDETRHDRFIASEERINIYASLYPELQADAGFLSDYAFILIVKEDYSTAGRVLEKAMNIRSSYHLNIQMGKVYKGLGNYDAAFACWNKAANMIPVRFMPLYLIIKLEYELGEVEKARCHAEEFMKKKVKIENPEIDFMKHEIKSMFNFNN